MKSTASNPGLNESSNERRKLEEKVIFLKTLSRLRRILLRHRPSSHTELYEIGSFNFSIKGVIEEQRGAWCF